MRRALFQWYAVVLAILAGVLVLGALLSGCAGEGTSSMVSGDAAQGPYRGYIDAGTPPDADGYAAETPAGVPDLSPDLGTPDVLPMPDVEPECPCTPWTPPPAGSPGDWAWTIVVSVPSEAMCFTFYSSLVKHLHVVQLPFRSVKINGTQILSAPNDVMGSWPGAQPVDGDRYEVRIVAGDPGTLAVTGWPSNSTGECP